MENTSIGNSVSVDDQSKNIEPLPMGHRSSKSAIATNSTSTANHLYRSQNRTITSQTVPSSAIGTAATGGDSSSSSSSSSNINSNRIPIPLSGTTINLKIQESSASSSTHLTDSDSNSLTSLAGGSNPQIIIKIQLAKMENGNEQPQTFDDDESSSESGSKEATTTATGATAGATNIGNGSGAAQFVNLTVNGNFIYTDDGSNDLVSLPSCSNHQASRSRTTAGGCTRLMNNNNMFDLSGRFNSLKIEEDWEQQAAIDAPPEYCEVLNETNAGDSSMKSLASTSNELTRSHSSLTDAVGYLSGNRRTKTSRSSSSSGLSRRRCRDALRRILEPTSNKSLNKNKKQNQKHSEATSSNATTANASSSSSITSDSVLSSKSSAAHLRHTAASSMDKASSTATRPSTVKASTTSVMTTTTTAVAAENAITSSTVPMATPTPTPSSTTGPISTSSTHSSASNNVFPISISAVGAASTATRTISNISSSNSPNQVSARIWTPSQNDLIIPITSPPQFVVVQCPPTSVVTLGRIHDYNAIRLSSSTEMGNASAGGNVNNGFINRNMPAESLVKQSHNGPIVHSQVDFVHCLVPDLDKIINSSFYWGKIDRYEAERLLEGKPEGTFLLRDSAQEEYLFSVTFRKFGRSLHARIEQSGHKFGFDCHDPSVFTAPTVTGLLQHYKDPTCVMFFEPMLTIPLHRKTAFSLQELARGVIVANTTYDGINELGLPPRVRAFLKEYYYKQKLRFKPLDEMVYWCT